ncbi:hypothetical protein ACFX2J_035797 [Malus domestica]
MKLGVNRNDGHVWALISYVDTYNPAPGPFRLDLKISTRVPKYYSLYGLKENSQPHGIKLYPNDPYILFTTDFSAINLNTDLYGSHPVYMDLRNVGNEAYAHSVLLLNSNGMDVFYRGTSLTYKVIGGGFDFYFFSAPTPLGVVDQYTAFIGRPAPMAYWSLVLRKSKKKEEPLLEDLPKDLSHEGFDQPTIDNNVRRHQRFWTRNKQRDGIEETLEADIRMFRKKLICKTTPMPIFYQEPPPTKADLKKFGELLIFVIYRKVVWLLHDWLTNSAFSTTFSLTEPKLNPSSAAANLHPPLPHFESCSRCTHQFNLHHPVIVDEATEFF